MADPSGSGEPVPAPTLKPEALAEIEAFRTHLAEQHRQTGLRPDCRFCRDLRGELDALRQENELLKTSRDGLREALTRIGEGHGPLCCGKGDCGEQIAAFARAALLGDVPLGSARPPLPPQELPEVTEDGWGRVKGEPSREPTLEEIVRATVDTLPGADYESTLAKVRARLSSPEAPREPKSTWPLESHVQETPPLRGRLHE